MDYRQQQYQQRNGGGRSGGGHYNNDNDRERRGGGDQRPWEQRGPPQHYSDNRGHRDQDGNGRGRGGGYRNQDREPYSGGRGADFDRKRRNDSNYDHDHAQKKERIDEPEPKPTPVPIEFEIYGEIDGKKVKFFVKNKDEVDKLVKLDRIFVHGKLDNSSMDKLQTSIILAKIGAFFAKGANITENGQKWPLSLQNEDVLVKAKSLYQWMLGKISSFVQMGGTTNMGLLVLPVFVDQVTELQLKVSPGSMLEIGSSGMKALLDWLHGRGKKKTCLKKLYFWTDHKDYARQFIQKLRMDHTQAYYAIRVRLHCKEPSLPEFSFPSGKCQIKFFKLKEAKNDQNEGNYMLTKVPEEQTDENLQVRDVESGLPEIQFTDEAKPTPVLQPKKEE